MHYGIGERKRTNSTFIEFLTAKEILRFYDGELLESDIAYEAFRFISEKVRIIFYYHRTRSTGHYSLRIRDDNSKDKEFFKKLAAELYHGSGLNNTFYQNHGENARDAYKATFEKETGWAEKIVSNISQKDWSAIKNMPIPKYERNRVFSN